MAVGILKTPARPKNARLLASTLVLLVSSAAAWEAPKPTRFPDAGQIQAWTYIPWYARNMRLALQAKYCNLRSDTWALALMDGLNRERPLKLALFRKQSADATAFDQYVAALDLWAGEARVLREQDVTTSGCAALMTSDNLTTADQIEARMVRDFH